MGKSFDDFFDEFMGEGKNREDSPKKGKPSKKGLGDLLNGAQEIDPNNLPDDMPPMIKQLIKSLSSFQPKKSDFMSDDLGEPDDEETTTDGDSTFNKQTWETDFGSVTRITVSGSIPPEGLDEDALREMMSNVLGNIKSKNKGIKRKKSLEEQLEVALKNEEYLEAARLRDEIAKKNQNSETLDNKGDEDENDWPF